MFSINRLQGGIKTPLVDEIGPTDGLIGMWSSSNLPEYPDNVAGTTYKSLPGWTSGADGWVARASETTVTVGGGKLIATRNTTPSGAQYIGIKQSIPYSGTKTVVLKITPAFSGVSSPVFGVRVPTLVDTTLESLGNNLYRVEAPANSGEFHIYAEILGGVSGDSFSIEFIYIGDGTYSSLSLDASGNGNHGTVYGATPVAGITGKALIGDGVNDKVNIAFPVSTQYSLCAWVKRTGAGVIQNIMYLCRSAGSRVLHLTFNATNNITLVLVDGTATVRTLTGAVLDTNWHFITGTHNGTTVNLYVDGVLVATATYSLAAITAPVGSLLHNAATGNTEYLNGTIDDPRIYNRALIAEEIKTLYKLGV